MLDKINSALTTEPKVIRSDHIIAAYQTPRLLPRKEYVVDSRGILIAFFKEKYGRVGPKAKKLARSEVLVQVLGVPTHGNEWFIRFGRDIRISLGLER